ncbi:MAG: PTS ascorbate transporter subunit IIC [Clostridiales Family XIII bacterium]|jgi:hypothetical protein|nr:PTS ascorbate transporter subunit IIC [Clostridiales Family XIII bacterium]
MDTNDNEKKGSEKKQIPLRLSAGLYKDLAAWAEDDFRSVNGQIEYLLTECVRRRKKGARDLAEQAPEEPFKADNTEFSTISC